MASILCLGRELSMGGPLIHEHPLFGDDAVGDPEDLPRLPLDGAPGRLDAQPLPSVDAAVPGAQEDEVALDDDLLDLLREPLETIGPRQDRIPVLIGCHDDVFVSPSDRHLFGVTREEGFPVACVVCLGGTLHELSCSGGVDMTHDGILPLRADRFKRSHLRRKPQRRRLARSYTPDVMDPRVRYVRTADDVGIAYWTVGQGRPLVQTPLVPFSHIEAEWQHPEMRRWYERLGNGATVVRYDARGTGSSERQVTDYSLDAHVRDLEAVVAGLGEGPVDLVGVFHTGPAAIAFAARNPERVRRLVLWTTYARGADYWRANQSEGLRTLRQTDYDLFLRTGAHELIGWSQGEMADRFADVMRRAVEPDTADRLIAETRDFDVTNELAAITCPTLVVHCRDLHWLDIALSRGLAAGIEDAHLAMIDGGSPLPGAGDIDDAAGLLEQFLGMDSPAAPPVPDSVRIVLFTDLVGHTHLVEELGDERGRDLLREHERLTRAALAMHGGIEVKTLGDGFMAAFGSVTGALRCAVAIQRSVATWNTSEVAQGLAPLAIRIGLAAGEPIEEDDDLFGASVILASRIAARAGAAQILVANTVRELGLGKDFTFEDRGDFAPRGLSEPVRVWELLW